jgi:hypothetical protein
MTEDGISQTTDDRPIFPDNADWVAPSRSSVATFLANGSESGSAAISHWSVAVRGETSTMYMKIISGQTSHHSPDDGGADGLRNVGLLSTTDTACCPRRFYREITYIYFICGLFKDAVSSSDFLTSDDRMINE